MPCLLFASAWSLSLLRGVAPYSPFTLVQHCVNPTNDGERHRGRRRTVRRALSFSGSAALALSALAGLLVGRSARPALALSALLALALLALWLCRLLALAALGMAPEHVLPGSWQHTARPRLQTNSATAVGGWRIYPSGGSGQRPSASPVTLWPRWRRLLGGFSGWLATALGPFQRDLARRLPWRPPADAAWRRFAGGYWCGACFTGGRRLGPHCRRRLTGGDAGVAFRTSLWRWSACDSPRDCVEAVGNG